MDDRSKLQTLPTTLSRMMMVLDPTEESIVVKPWLNAGVFMDFLKAGTRRDLWLEGKSYKAERNEEKDSSSS